MLKVARTAFKVSLNHNRALMILCLSNCSAKKSQAMQYANTRAAKHTTMTKNQNHILLISAAHSLAISAFSSASVFAQSSFIFLSELTSRMLERSSLIRSSQIRFR